MGNKRYNNPFQATLAGIRDLYRKKGPPLTLSEAIPIEDLTVVITGSSSGLGFAVAEELARRKARIVMAIRSGIPDKGNEITERTGNENVFMYPVDLSLFDSIDALVDQLSEKHPKIDMLISNAAMVPSESRKTPDGIEEMFMVNYLAGFYLSQKLLSRGLISSEHPGFPRIIFVSSESHRNPEDFDWENFGRYQSYGMGKTVARYGYLKLLLTTYAVELSRRLNENEHKISVRALCPGPVNSNIARESPVLFQPLIALVFRLFFRSPKKASAPVIYFATEPSPQGRNMDYLFLMHRKPVDEKAEDPDHGEMLWEKSMALLKELGRSID